MQGLVLLPGDDEDDEGELVLPIQLMWDLKNVCVCVCVISDVCVYDI